MASKEAKKPESAPSEADKKEQYELMQKKLKESIAKRNALEEDLIKLEEDIYSKETQYLANGVMHGNIIRGFENFSKTNTSSSARVRKIQFTDEDRIFSLSSSAYVNHLRRTQAENGTFEAEEEDEYSSEKSTPRRRR